MALKKELPQRFWIPLSDWMISDIISNEVLSPPGYYPKRDFGVSELAFPDQRGVPIHPENGIAMFTTPYKFHPSNSKPVYLLLKSDALKERLISQVDKDIFLYLGSIYLNRGNFQIRFYEEGDYKLFKVRSKMSLEAKTLSKYLVSDFFSSKDASIIRFDDALKGKKPLTLSSPINAPEGIDEYYFDKAFNHIKGFIYGFLVGVSKNKGNSDEPQVSRLKSMINGFKTRLIMAESFSEEPFTAINIKIQEFLNEETEDLLHSIRKKLEEVKDLQKLHFEMLADQNEKIQNIEEEHLNRLKNRLEALKSEKAEIKNSINELMVKKSGIEDAYKAIYRPKKGTEEYYRKQDFKEKIEEIKNVLKALREEHKEIREAMASIENELSPYMNYGHPAYQSTIDDLFYRISRDLNQQILDTQRSSESELKLDDITFLNRIIFSVEDVINLTHNSDALKGEPPSKIFKEWDFSFLGLEDKEKKTLLFVKIINAILANSQDSSTDVSIIKRNNIVNYLLSLLDEEDEHRNEVIQFLEFLTNKAETFDLPTGSNVLQNFFSFILKIQNNEKLEAYLELQGIKDRVIAFIFYGTFMGFSNLPKTFTNPIFTESNNDLLDQIDQYLFENYLL